MGPKITLYVDTVSPFGYEAYWILRHDPVFSKCDITYVPVFLGGIMKKCGNPTPISIKNKDKWITAERMKWANLFSIPMKKEIPPKFPAPTLTIMRALCALTSLHPGAEGQDILIKSLDRLFEAYWVNHQETFDNAVLERILNDVLGKEEVARVLKLLPTEGKAILAKNSDKAFDDGAFGLPWFVAMNEKGEMENFWGVDHIARLTEFLGLEKPRTGGWKSVL